MVTAVIRVVRSWSRTALPITTLLIPLIAAGAEPPSPQPLSQPAPAQAIETAPVSIDGEVLFWVRGVSSFPAKRRAQEIVRRIEALAQNEGISVSELTVEERADRARILAGGHHLLTVFDIDAEAEELASRQLLAEVHKARIAEAIERYRRERTGASLGTQAVHAAIVLALLVGLLFSLRWLFQWSGRVVERYFQRHLTELEARSYQLLSVEELKNAWQGGLRVVHWLISFVLVFAGLDYILSLFPWTRALARQVAALLINPLATMWNGVVEAVPGLVFIIILAIVIRYLLRLTRLFFNGVAYGRIRPAGFEQEWAWPTYRLLRFVVIAFAVIIAYPYIPGSDSDAFKGVSIFLGLLMSLGAASMVANSLAGYALIYRRAFRIGDRIKVGDIVGDVVAMRQQVTQLRTPKNEEVTIPSSTLLSSSVVNYSALAREDGLILHTTVGIGYETPWRQVEAMLIEAANRTEGLKREPAPFVLQTALGDFCITYEINAYCDRPEEMARLYTALHRNILDVFNEHGVQIMTPNYVADTQQPKLVPKEQWYAAPAGSPSK